MFSSIKAWGQKLAETPPFTLVAQQALRRKSTTALTRVRWNIADRANYLLGVSKAATQATAEGIKEISVIEFGVASGEGLLALERCARDVEAESNVSIKVYGFDSGGGLPVSCGDYRDHPDFWTPSDYPMDVAALRAKLSDRTALVLGDVAETVPSFLTTDYPPIGFISYDLDYYSSTRHALQVLSASEKKTLRRVFLYFDDVDSDINHRFAGELLAIDEFNANQDDVKIDHWRGVSRYTLFWHPLWLRRMYIAHDLQAITATVPNRAPLRL